MAIVYTSFDDPSRLTPGQQEEARWRERNVYNVANQFSQAALQQAAIDSYLESLKPKPKPATLPPLSEIEGLASGFEQAAGGSPMLREEQFSPVRLARLPGAYRERLAKERAQDKLTQEAAARALGEQTREWLGRGGYGDTPGDIQRQRSLGIGTIEGLNTEIEQLIAEGTAKQKAARMPALQAALLKLVNPDAAPFTSEEWGNFIPDYGSLRTGLVDYESAPYPENVGDEFGWPENRDRPGRLTGHGKPQRQVRLGQTGRGY